MHSLVSKELAYQLTLFNYRIASYDWKLREKVVFGKPLNDGLWHHAALVFRNAVRDGSQLFLDGKPIGIPFTYNVLDQGAELYIGGNHFTDQYFSGNIDEVRIWKKPRSISEIKNSYNKEIEVDENGLVLYYKFNTIIDDSNFKKNEIITNEALPELNGRLYDFQMKDTTSNFVKNSPLISTNNFNILLKIKKNFYTILWIICVLCFTFLTVVIRTRILEKQKKILEQKVQDKTDELIKSLQQKEILIQEIHHRVKNNLQFIISLIDFESVKSNDKILAKDALQNTSRRLIAMVLVHEMLYRKDNIETISVKAYLIELINSLKNFSENNKKIISYEVDVDDFPLSIIQCTSIGIITTEIITNCLKHAFNGTAKPRIFLKLKINSELNEAEFTIADNGAGINIDDAENSSGIGKKLIDVFCRQLGGTYCFKNENGVVFNLLFSLKNIQDKDVD